ncbi:MAG: Mu transposase C-terminal domain-containing protein [Actinomycetota bacterium]
MAEAFRWSVNRVTTAATVSLAGNRYQVDPALVRRRVELRYDPEDLSRIDVYLEGSSAGVAVPLLIARHIHPQVPQAQAEPPTPTGVDYLGLVLSASEETCPRIAFRDLTEPEPPGEGGPRQAGRDNQPKGPEGSEP